MITLIGSHCSNSEDNTIKDETYQRLKNIIDSIGKENIATAFGEGTGFTVIYFTNKENSSSNKLTYLPGYPFFSDSILIKTRKEFYSPRLQTTYHIKDSTVICIKQVPIFHPNSNLKGQTPWKQPYVNTYKRLD